MWQLKGHLNCYLFHFFQAPHSDRSIIETRPLRSFRKGIEDVSMNIFLGFVSSANCFGNISKIIQSCIMPCLCKVVHLVSREFVSKKNIFQSTSHSLCSCCLFSSIRHCSFVKHAHCHSCHMAENYEKTNVPNKIHGCQIWKSKQL